MQWNTDYLLRTLLIPSAYQGMGISSICSKFAFFSWEKKGSKILFLKCSVRLFRSKYQFLACMPYRLAHLMECLCRYLLHYILDYTESNDLSIRLAGVILACLVVGLIGFGKLLFIV